MKIKMSLYITVLVMIFFAITWINIENKDSIDSSHRGYSNISFQGTPPNYEHKYIYGNIEKVNLDSVRGENSNVSNSYNFPQVFLTALIGTIIGFIFIRLNEYLNLRQKTKKSKNKLDKELSILSEFFTQKADVCLKTLIAYDDSGFYCGSTTLAPLPTKYIDPLNLIPEFLVDCHVLMSDNSLKKIRSVYYKISIYNDLHEQLYKAIKDNKFGEKLIARMAVLAWKIGYLCKEIMSDEREKEFTEKELEELMYAGYEQRKFSAYDIR